MLYYRVIGDAQALPFKPAIFDIIFCTYVLEHLPDPQQALQGMFAAVKEGGLLVLDFPNLYSLKGLAAKFTPLWFHRWVYRWILNKPGPGTDGQLP
jgi:ubiquinone/menaquinone biosynthesis C-methylase UbiE